MSGCFNPHPAFWPDATRWDRDLPAIELRFQSSSGLLAGCNTTRWPMETHYAVFQSSSGLLAGCNLYILGGLARMWVVQSSSGLLAGCNHRRLMPPRLLLCFNPHPAFWPDATPIVRARGTKVECFNPHPAFWPDATSTSGWTTSRTTRFNPHPAFWPDATRFFHPCFDQRIRVSILIRPSGRMQQVFHKPPGQGLGVSILIRPSGRMQPAVSVRLSDVFSVSILIRPSGRMQLRLRLRHSDSQEGFNPHPAFWPDATCASTAARPSGSSFNPHPAFWPDATCCTGGTIMREVDVSILIRPSGRMQPVSSLRKSELARVFQSSSGLLAGCNGITSIVNDEGTLFQSSSGLLAGCNGSIEDIYLAQLEVSILIRPSGRMQRTYLHLVN